MSNQAYKEIHILVGNTWWEQQPTIISLYGVLGKNDREGDI